MQTQPSLRTCPINLQWQDVKRDWQELRTNVEFASIGRHRDAYVTTSSNSAPEFTIEHFLPKNCSKWKPNLTLDLPLNLVSLQSLYLVKYFTQFKSIDEISCLTSESEFKLPTQKNGPAVEKTLIQIYVKSESGADADALKIAFDYIEGSLAEGNLEKVDAFLEKFQPERIKRIVSVGVVRSTFRARSDLKEWNHCFARVANILDEKKQSPSKYLRGLFPANGQRLLAKRHAI